MIVLLAIILIIITLLILVIPHEFGHFIMAKRFGIKVLEFGFGIPPRIFGKQVGETLISLNWLPLGGFVRLLGEDEVNEGALTDKRSFAAAPVGKRITVVVAGVVINLILAWLIFYGLLAAHGFKADLPLLFPHRFVGVSQQNETIVLVGEVEPNSPAASAGIKSGDRVMAFDGQTIGSDQQLVDDTKKFEGQKVTLTLANPDKTKSHNVDLTPRVNPPAGQGAMGVFLSKYEVAHITYAAWWQKLFAGVLHSYNIVVYSGQFLGQMIGQSIQTHNVAPVRSTVAGPVGIVSLIGEIIKAGTAADYFNLLAALSLNLAIVNILPFPGLDGGRFFFLAIEAITKKRPHPLVERYVHTVGLAILIGLILLITLSDVQKLIF